MPVIVACVNLKGGVGKTALQAILWPYLVSAKDVIDKDGIENQRDF